MTIPLLRGSVTILAWLLLLCGGPACGLEETISAVGKVSEGSGDVSNNDSFPDDLILATSTAGSIRLGEVSLEARFVSRDERRFRQQQGMGRDEQWRDWTRRAALRRIAPPLLRARGLDDDPLLQAAARRAAREWALDRWRRRCYGLPFEAPSDEVLAGRLPDEAPPAVARLRLSHLFLAAEGPEEVARARDQLAAWRREVVDLQSFRQLATVHSDSKSALKGGRLGYLRRGWLPPAAEQILYRLPAGSVSEPIELRGGVHLFFVEKNEPAMVRPRSPEEERQRQELRLESQLACRARRLEGIDDRLRVGKAAVPGPVMQQLEGQRVSSPELAVQRWVEQESLYLWALSHGELTAEEVAYSDILASNHVLGALLRDLRQDDVVEPSEADLQALYAAEPDGYRTPWLVSLWVATAQPSAGQDPLIFLKDLEGLAAGLADGRRTWEGLAKEPAGGLRVERFEGVPAIEIGSRFSPFLLSRLASLAVGDTTEVIQDAADFHIIHLWERRAPARKSFAEARESLRRRWIRRHQRQASAKVVSELLAAANFQWTLQGQEFLSGLRAEPAP